MWEKMKVQYLLRTETKKTRLFGVFFLLLAQFSGDNLYIYTIMHTKTRGSFSKFPYGFQITSFS